MLANLDQKSLASRAGVSLNAIKHLESGKGARVNSLVKVLRALDKADWLETLAPAVSICPMQMLKKGSCEPKRAWRRVRSHVSARPDIAMQAGVSTEAVERIRKHEVRI